MNETTTFDAISTGLILTRLHSATDEAAEVIRRTALSTLVTESNDFAIIITDSYGNLVAQNSESIPAFIGTLPTTLKELIKKFGNTIARGDVLATNDPWIASGHLNDITIVKPIFNNGRVAGYVGSCAHAPDIGGRKRSLESRDVFEEGFMIPPMKIINNGQVDQTFFSLYRAASRMPSESEGDLWAAIAALSLVDARTQDVLSDYGLSSLDKIAKEVNYRSEMVMREAISRVPEGRYTYSFDTDGFEDELHFAVELVMENGHVKADFSGTSDSVTRAINCPLTYTFAMTAYALKCVLFPEVPNCEGVLKCFSVTAPAGSIVNPSHPSPVAGRAAVGQYIPALILGALAKALPDKISGMPGSPLWSCVLSGRKRGGKMRSTTLFFNGGMGATSENDGECCLSFPSNVSGVPVEIVEIESPIIIHHKRLAVNSGGNGEHRGGLGIEVSFEIDSDLPISLSVIAERCKHPAPGLLGGHAGATGRVLIDGVAVNHRRDLHLVNGQIVTFQTPGGGGLGSPAKRDPSLIARDTRLGYLT